MQVNKIIALLAATLNTSLLAGPAEATDTAANYSTNLPALKLPAFKVAIRDESGPGQVATRRAFLNAGTNKFAFIMPDGLRMDSSDPKRVTLASADYSCIISVSFLNSVSPDAAELDAETCRQVVLSRYPGAKILEEFALAAANRGGPAFDLKWTPGGQMARSARVAFIPSAAGVLEFSLDSTQEKFPQAQRILHLLMLSFRASNAEGKLENAPLLDKI